MRVPSTQVQNNFGKYLKFAEASEEVIVTRNGKDIARILRCDPSDNDRIMEEAAVYNTTGTWVTYEEFLELAEKSERPYELIDGVIYDMASPSYKHQHAVGELHAAFHNWFKGKACTPLTSPFDVTLHKAKNNTCVVQPDIVVICDKEHITHDGKYQGIPALVVEVLSPSTRSKDMIIKLDLYKQCGIKECWIIDPLNEHIMVYALDNNDIANYRVATNSSAEEIPSFYFEGLRVAPRDVFA